MQLGELESTELDNWLEAVPLKRRGSALRTEISLPFESTAGLGEEDDEDMDKSDESTLAVLPGSV